MELAIGVISMVLPVLAAVGIGRLAAKREMISAAGMSGIRTVIGDITLPLVLFNAFFTASYNLRMLIVFVCVFAGYGIALAFGFFAKRFVRPYDRFMPFLLTNAEGGMLGYSLYALLVGADQTSVFAVVDIGQTVAAYTLFLSALRIADGQSPTPGKVLKDVITNKACIGMLLGIVLGVTGISNVVLTSSFAPVVTQFLSFITAPTSVLILLIVGYDFKLSKELIRPVLRTVMLRILAMAVLFVIVSGIVTGLAGYSPTLILALALMYILPAPFIIPLFANVGEDGAYISTTLSVQTLLTIVLFIPLAVWSRFML